MNILKAIKHTLVTASALSLTVLTTLKLTNVIAWSWLWVTLPVWWPLLPLIAVAGAVYLVLMFELVGSVFK